MILDLQKLSYNMLLRGLTEAHVEGLVDFRFMTEKNIPSPLKNAVKKAAKAKYLDDADMVLVFKIAQNPKPQEGQGGENQAPEGQEGNVSEGEVQAAENSETTETRDTVVKTIERAFYLGDRDETKIETISIELGEVPAYLVKFTFPE